MFMRRLSVCALLICLSFPIIASANPAEVAKAQRKERSARIGAFWSGVFAKPKPGSFSVGGFYGTHYLETAAGAADSATGYGLMIDAPATSFGWRSKAASWLGVSGLTDYAHGDSGTQTLAFDTRIFSAALALGLDKKFGRWRFVAQPMAGMRFRSLQIDDHSSPVRTLSQFQPFYGLRLGAAVGLFGRAYLSLELQTRRVTSRRHSFLGLGLMIPLGEGLLNDPPSANAADNAG